MATDNPILETDRLFFRPLVPADLDELAALYSDAAVMEYLGGLRSRSETDRYLQDILEAYDTRGFSLWATTLKQGQHFIGRCGLLLQTVDDRLELEIGYALKRSAWGMGLGTEAASALRDYALSHDYVWADVPQRDRLISIVHVHNRASQRVAEKVGMHWEKTTTFKGFPVNIFAMHR